MHCAICICDTVIVSVTILLSLAGFVFCAVVVIDKDVERRVWAVGEAPGKSKPYISDSLVANFSVI